MVEKNGCRTHQFDFKVIRMFFIDGHEHHEELRECENECERIECDRKDCKEDCKKLVLEVCIDDCVELCDGQPFNFVITECVPKFDNCCPEVLLKIRKRLIPLEDVIGDFVFANQIRPRKVYYGIYGNHPEHVLTRNIPRTPRF